MAYVFMMDYIKMVNKMVFKFNSIVLEIIGLVSASMDQLKVFGMDTMKMEC
jgi:hypothetical protein